MIRPNRAYKMRARRLERGFFHCGNVVKVDNRRGCKEGGYFEYQYRRDGGVGNGYLRYGKYLKRDLEMVIQRI